MTKEPTATIMKRLRVTYETDDEYLADISWIDTQLQKASYPDDMSTHYRPEYMLQKIERASAVIARSFRDTEWTKEPLVIARVYRILFVVPPMDDRPLFTHITEHFRFRWPEQVMNDETVWLKRMALCEDITRRRCAQLYCRKFELDEAA